MFTKDLHLYVEERPEKTICLGKVGIIIYTIEKKFKVKANKQNQRCKVKCRRGHRRRLKYRWRRKRKCRHKRGGQRKKRRRLPGCPKNIATDVERNLKDRVFGRKKDLLWRTLHVTEENCSDLKQQKIQKLTISFWCQSGMECFKPTEEPSKNCVEVAIFGFIMWALKAVKKRRKIVKTYIEYMTDLSPCYVCRRRLSEQKRKMKKKFRNIKIKFKDNIYVMDYDTYKIIVKEYDLKRQEKRNFSHLLSYFEQIVETLGNKGCQIGYILKPAN